MTLDVIQIKREMKTPFSDHMQNCMALYSDKDDAFLPSRDYLQRSLWAEDKDDLGVWRFDTEPHELR